MHASPAPTNLGTTPARALVIDPARCTRCGACILACPKDAITEPNGSSCAKCVKYCTSMEVPCSPAQPSISRGRCDLCGQCIVACREGAIVWTTSKE